MPLPGYDHTVTVRTRGLNARSGVTLQAVTVTGSRVAHNVVFADRGVVRAFALPEQSFPPDSARRDEPGRCRRYR